MDMNSLLFFGATVAGSTLAAVLAARWARGNKQDRDIATLEAKIEALENAKALEFRAVEHRLNALEQERDMMRKRYHKLRWLVLRCLMVSGVKEREHTIDDNIGEESDE